jgi:translation initiation factor IF-3
MLNIRGILGKRFRGRELSHPQIGQEAMKRFAEACADAATVERAAKLDGRHMLMFLAPIKAAPTKKEEK